MNANICPCGSHNHRHGNRLNTLTHCSKGRFELITSRVQRYKCPGCGRTFAEEVPPSIPGFRMTKEASARLIELAMSHELHRCAELSGVDRSTISRLLQVAAADKIVASAPVRTCRLEMVRQSTVAIQNPSTGRTLGYVNNAENDLTKSILQRLDVKVLMPCAQLAARALTWRSDFVVSLAKHDFRTMLTPIFRKAALRFAALIKPRNVSPTAFADLISSDVTDLSPEEANQLGELAPPGSTARGFMRMRERLLAVHDASDLTSARHDLTEWISDCNRNWKATMSGVLRFLESYADVILAHSYSLIHVAKLKPLLDLRPASVLTLELLQKRSLAPSFDGPRFSS